jgi:hypothetical protein
MTKRTRDFARKGLSGIKAFRGGRLPRTRRPYMVALAAAVALALVGGPLVNGTGTSPKTPAPISVRAPDSDYAKRLNWLNDHPLLTGITFVDREKLASALAEAGIAPAAAGAEQLRTALAAQTGTVGDFAALPALAELDKPVFQRGWTLPSKAKPAKRGEAGACLVIGSSPFTTPAEEAALLTGIDAGKFDPSALPSKAEFALFNDLREAARCHGGLGLEALGWKNAGRPEALTVHQEETFADIYAVLFAAKEGHTRLAGRLALLRALGALEQGSSTVVSTDQLIAASGAIRADHVALETAQALIDSLGPEKLKLLVTEGDIAYFARKIVAERALSDEDFTELDLAFRTGLSGASVTAAQGPYMEPMAGLIAKADAARKSLLKPDAPAPAAKPAP